MAPAETSLRGAASSTAAPAAVHTLFRRPVCVLLSAATVHMRRFKRLSHGTDRASILELTADPALARQPFAARLLQLHDGDGDGVLTEAELLAAVDTLTRLTSPVQRSECEPLFTRQRPANHSTSLINAQGPSTRELDAASIYTVYGSPL